MKHPLKHILLIVTLLFGAFFQMSAQNTYVHLIITMNDGTEETYDMYSTSYMYFESGDQLVITETVDGLSYVRYPLSSIRKITCHETEGTPENSNLSITLSPNPAHNKVTFRNIQGTQTAKIYALDGRMVKSFSITEGHSVDVTDLPTGMYLVNIGYCTFKMMKL